MAEVPQPPQSTPAPVPAPKPAVPAKDRGGSAAPSGGKKPAEEVSAPGRRQFLSWFALAWISFVAATSGALALVMRFMFPNVLFEPKSTFKAGFPDDYEVGLVDERWKEKYGVWIMRVSEGLYALSTVCTHLGCTPNWLLTEQKFKCPCHGSGFFKTGINFEGPAPRPLERYKIGLADDGQILIDKSKKFQQEKGEWNNPDSFLTV
jgi:cytochrome b6-f complex iron-sulfur subunit